MNVAQHFLVFAVRLYQRILSPAGRLVFGPLAGCRFTPTCSAYALDAVRAHGAIRGSWLALKRIGRCHPWGGCGDDPVPPPRKSEVRIPTSETSPNSDVRNPNGRRLVGTGSRLWIGLFSDFTFRIWDLVVSVLRRRHFSAQGVSERR